MYSQFSGTNMQISVQFRMQQSMLRNESAWKALVNRFVT